MNGNPKFGARVRTRLPYRRRFLARNSEPTQRRRAGAVWIADPQPIVRLSAIESDPIEFSINTCTMCDLRRAAHSTTDLGRAARLLSLHDPRRHVSPLGNITRWTVIAKHYIERPE